MVQSGEGTGTGTGTEERRDGRPCHPVLPSGVAAQEPTRVCTQLAVPEGSLVVTMTLSARRVSAADSGRDGCASDHGATGHWPIWGT